MIFNNKSSLPIGIDISDLSIKLVQLNKSRDKIDLLALGKTKIPAGMIENGVISNFEGVADLIKKMVNKPVYGSISGNDVVACLPETKTYLKLIKIEHSPNKLTEIIGAEIEKNIPISISDIYYDWQIITSDNSHSYVLVGAAPRNLVNSYIKLLNISKLQISALEIEAAAISRTLLAEESPKFHSDHSRNYAIIDIGAKRTSMIIYAQNTIVMTISMPISGEAITKKIAETLEIKNDQAEKAKIICGLDKTKAQGIIRDILSEMIGSLTKKISAALEYYNSQYSKLGPVSNILICGGGSNVNDLANIIHDKIGIETSTGNILTNINFDEEKLKKIFTEKHNINLKIFKAKRSKTVSIEQNTSLTYTTAVGLGLRDAFIPKF